MSKKKVTLRAVGDFFRENLTSNVGWVTLDCSGIRVFNNRGGKDNPPKYDRNYHMWLSPANKLISIVSLTADNVITRDYEQDGKLDYARCIECVDPSFADEPSDGRKKATRHKSAVLAYFADGTTLRFDCKSEAKAFFGLKRVEDVTRYIETGHTLPDGTTTLDEAMDSKPAKASKKVDIQSKRKRKK